MFNYSAIMWFMTENHILWWCIILLMVHFRHQLKCFSCYDIGVPNQIVLTLHMSICVIFVLSYLSTYIYIYILLWANFWGMSFGFLVVLKIYNNCLWQIVISKLYQQHIYQLNLRWIVVALSVNILKSCVGTGD